MTQPGGQKGWEQVLVKAAPPCGEPRSISGKPARTMPGPDARQTIPGRLAKPRLTLSFVQQTDENAYHVPDNLSGSINNNILSQSSKDLN